MKKLFVISVGAGMLATAGATAVSSSNFGLANENVEIGAVTLSPEQTKALQARYRYWSSPQTMTLKTPI